MAINNFMQQSDIKQDRIQSFAFVIGIIVCVLFSIGFAVSGFSRLRQSCEIELESRINPNNASVASLMRLPGTINLKTGKQSKIISGARGWVSADTVSAWGLPMPKARVAREKPVSSGDAALDALVLIGDDEERLRGALKFISPDGRGEWLSVGMALEAASLPAGVGFSLWDSWSQGTKAGNYCARGQRDAWDGFDSSKASDTVGVPTIYFKARAGGWTDPRLDVLADFDQEKRFDPEAITAMALLKTTDLGAWLALRDTLANKGAVDKLVSKEVRAQARVILNPQAKVRFVYQGGHELGWLKVFQPDKWVETKASTVSTWLSGRGMDAAKEMSLAIDQAFKIANIPFSPEYPEHGVWNRLGAQLAFEPAEGEHPMWNRILEGLGEGINVDVLADEWCRRSGIVTGAQYLLTWIAAMFQRPAEKLAYLFLFSESESTGKSTLHESLATLMTRGWVLAKRSLTTDFNGELDGQVLAVVDDFALPAKKGQVHNTVKELITGDFFSCRALFMQAVNVRSYLHWIHTANTRSACPVFDGDTRITVIEVLGADEKVTREVLRARVKAEGPAFLHTVMHLKLPAAGERLLVPALDGSWKQAIAQENMDEFERWLSDTPGWVWKTDEEIQEGFLDTLHHERAVFWPPHKLRQSLPAKSAGDRALATWLRKQGTWSGLSAELVPRFGSSAVAVGRSLSRLSRSHDKVLRKTRMASGTYWGFEWS